MNRGEFEMQLAVAQMNFKVLHDNVKTIKLMSIDRADLPCFMDLAAQLERYAANFEDLRDRASKPRSIWQTILNFNEVPKKLLRDFVKLQTDSTRTLTEVESVWKRNCCPGA